MITVACAALLCHSAVVAAAPAPFDAEYGVYRDGKRIGRASIKLEAAGDGLYRYSRNSKAVKGLAKFLNTSETETAEFELLNGGFRPQRYYSRIKVAGRKRGWQAEFDWQQNRIAGSSEDGPFELATEAGLRDPVTRQVTLMDALAEERQTLEFRVLDGPVIEDRNFKSEAAPGYTTAIGCTDAVKVDRIRPGSNRYTTSWHVSSAAFTLVRLDHGKRGEKSNSMRLERLSIDGKVITFADECADTDT
jgi:hypothetical protein